MPIGNLTSQIFSNIYLNELDRFVKHKLKPKAYLRYGDDFILFEPNKIKLENFRTKTIEFLESKLKLQLNPKNDIIIKPSHGLKFLGVKLYPSGRKLTSRNKKRIANRLNSRNISSYYGNIKQHENKRSQKLFSWQTHNKL